MAGASPFLPAGWVSKPTVMQVEVHVQDTTERLRHTNVYYSSQESPSGKYDTLAVNNFTRSYDFIKL